MRYHSDAGEMSLLKAHQFRCTPSPKVVTQDNLDQNKARMGACTNAATVLKEIPNPVVRDVLEDALGRVFFAFNMTDWESGSILLRPIGFGVLLGSGLREAAVNVGLWFARTAQVLTWGSAPHGPHALRLYRTVLGRLMMQMYKKAVREGDTHELHVEGEEGCRLLLRKGGTP